MTGKFHQRSKKTMFGLGMPEILLILAIALIVIGPQKLPDLAKTLGRAMGEFKKAAQEFKRSIDVETTVKDMKDINISNDIIPVGEFKSNLAYFLKEIQEKRNTLVITQNGKPAGVLLSPAEFDELKQSIQYIESVARGLKDAENGDVFSTAQLKEVLKRNRSK